MKKSIYNLLAAFVLVSGIISCNNKKDTTGLLIPKDAMMVFHVNGASMLSKVDWKEVMETNIFRKIYQESGNDTMALQLMNNPESSGVDTKSDFVYFFRKVGAKSYMVAEGKIKDKAAFATFVSMMNKDLKPTLDNGMNTMSIGLKGALVWNDTHFAYVFDVPMPANGLYGGRKRFSMDDMTPIPADSLKKLGKETLNLKSSETLGNDSRFSALIKQEGDMHFWVSPGKMYSNMMPPYMSMMKLNVLVDDYVAAMTLNFEAGKISLKSKQYYSKELSGLIKKYDAKPVDAAVINRLPSQDVLAILAFNFPPKAIKDFLTLTGMEGLVNLMMAKTNYTIDDFIKANKGEVLLAVTDFKMKTISDTFPSFDTMASLHNAKPHVFTMRKPDPKIIFASAINDKKAFDQLLFLIESESSKRRKPSEMTYKMNNDWFVASNTEAYIDQFLAGNKNDLPIAKVISGEPVAGYINLERLFKEISEYGLGKPDISGLSGDLDNYVSETRARKDSMQRAAIAASAAMWQNVIIKGGSYKDGGIEFTAEANLINKTDNSLKQLIRYINQLSIIYEKEMDKAIKGAKEMRDEEVEMPPPASN